ncbi:methyltransferase [Xylophilus sp. ASV27]|uniref:methyltransferase n=1 Tax=Xylophilus sp. ASV27 TaxID=2795129 RepID=UPI0018EBDA35|nr:methyltransferase [Xylophilus sp. ASV27]
MQSLPLARHSAPPSWRAAWRERWLALRDRLLASRAFQRRAAAFPLTRPIAQRRAGALFDLVAGFVYSQVLLACVQLRLFDLLSQGPLALNDIAQRLDLPAESAERLLAAAVALRLVEARSGGRFGLGELGAPMVGNTAIAAMVEHHRALYADLADPVALLRGQARSAALAGYWPYAGAARPDGLSGDSVAEYSALMAASQPLVCDEILDAYALHGHRCLLDVGGGEGAFLISAAARAPSLRLMLFDLPAVAERARARCAAAGLGARLRIEGGSFLTDPLPKGADIATLVRVIHDHDDAAAMRILDAVRQALSPGGTLLLAEPMAHTPGAESMGDAYFGFYLLAMGKGKPRSAATLQAMLHSAGFQEVRQVPTRMPLQVGLIVARTGLAS